MSDDLIAMVRRGARGPSDLDRAVAVALGWRYDARASTACHHDVYQTGAGLEMLPPFSSALRHLPADTTFDQLVAFCRRRIADLPEE